VKSLLVLMGFFVALRTCPMSEFAFRFSFFNFVHAEIEFNYLCD